MVKKKLKIAIFHLGFFFSGGGPQSMLTSVWRLTASHSRGAQLRGYSALFVID